MKKILLTLATTLLTTTAFAGSCNLVGELQDDGTYAKPANGRVLDYKRTDSTLSINDRITLTKTEVRDGYTFYTGGNGLAAKMSEPIEFEGKMVRKYYTTPVKLAIADKWVRAYACKGE